MKRLLICWLFFSALTFAQNGSQQNFPGAPLQFAGVPSGTCNATQLSINTLNGDFYDCPSGTWVKVAGSLPSGLSYAAPTLTVSSAGNGSGVLALSGNTSGACSHTAGATGATETTTCQQLGLDGSTAAPAYSFASQPGFGFQRAGTSHLALSTGASYMLDFTTTYFAVPSGASIGFSPTTSAAGGFDAGISRDGAGIVDVGSTLTAGDTTGKLKAAGYISVGTKFTSNAGCTESTLVGGATAGKFTVGQGTACTIILTMGNTATAPNGWSCWANDQTAVPAVAIRQTASTTTTASLLMTVATNDVVSFGCLGY